MTDNFQPLTGQRRLWAGIILAVANLMVILDTTIANVSVPHISGSLGISPSQGTWVITSYAVAEAVCVPLTGWLAQRFGVVRVFVAGMLGFGIFSMLCGMSVTLGMLVACRIGQGLCGGPLMPLSQTLLLRIYPPEKRGQAMGMWAMTTLVGPVLGPILGGVISDSWSWHWIFFINIPVALGCAFGAMTVLSSAETATAKVPIDRVGLMLLVLWIGALQIMLDIGREHDWFADTTVVVLGIVALVGLIAFVIWELTEEHPIVDLRIFRHRGFTVGVTVLSLGFGTYFAGIVVIPQWLQITQGYTATWAGLATSFTGMAALLVAMIPGKLQTKVDPRILASGGLVWIGGATLLRTQWTSGLDFGTLILPQLIMGLGMPFFFITITTLSLGSVLPRETASAAGLQSFTRTIGLAFATSVVTTYWDNQGRISGSEIAGKLNSDAMSTTLAANGFSLEQTRVVIAQLVDKEAVMLATDKVFLVAGLLMWAIAALIWFAPRPKKIVAGGGH